jgi:glycosyltransferase involved in cell wall biosynthesis
MKDVLIYNGFPEEKIRVIPYFTDLPSIEKNETINRPPHILALGRITKEKGFDCLIRAYSAIQGRAHLTIVGDGPELTNLKQLAEKLRIASTVHFTGWLSHERLDELYRQCALVVVPSIWPEPFCIVGIEAMAYAKPVIAFDVGGISDWLKDGKTGYLIRLKDIEDLTSKIDFSLKNRQLSIEMGHAGRAAAEKYFTAEIHCESLLNLLQKAIDNHVV